jgi:hypothetical protein
VVDSGIRVLSSVSTVAVLSNSVSCLGVRLVDLIGGIFRLL